MPKRPASTVIGTRSCTGLDYLVYAYLQGGQDNLARKQRDWAAAAVLRVLLRWLAALDRIHERLIAEKDSYNAVRGRASGMDGRGSGKGNWL